MYKSLLVVDDFYSNPMEVRRAALSADYPAVTGVRTFPGRNSAQPFSVPGLDQVASQLANEPIAGDTANANSFHCHFRITVGGEVGRYNVHADPSHLAMVGICYLTLPEHCQGGTTFFRHRQTGTDRTPRQEDLEAAGYASVAELLQRDGKETARWETLMTIPMRFNRLVLYRPFFWHSAGPAFGDAPENGRLIQLFSFVRAAAAQRQGA